MDPRVVVRAQHGDEVAFAEITRSLYGRAFAIAARILRDRDQAQDATQQAFVNIWRHLPRLREPARFEAWAYRLIVNACYTEAKRLKRWRTLRDTRRDVTPPDDIGAVGDRDMLERAFRELTVDQRAVIVLHYQVGMTMTEVAATLDIPLGTASSRLGRAMTKLRGALSEERRGGLVHGHGGAR